MAEGLRVWFYRYPEELYDGMLKIAALMMDDAVSVSKGQKMELGYIVVLQTAGIHCPVVFVRSASPFGLRIT